MEIGLNLDKRKIHLKVKKLSVFGKFVGLMFSRRKNAKAFLFEFGKQTRTPIHSLFVFFPFIAIWIDEHEKIIEIRKIPSWKLKISPEKPFKKLIEIPLNDNYKGVIRNLTNSRR